MQKGPPRPQRNASARRSSAARSAACCAHLEIRLGGRGPRDGTGFWYHGIRAARTAYPRAHPRVAHLHSTPRSRWGAVRRPPPSCTPSSRPLRRYCLTSAAKDNVRLRRRDVFRLCAEEEHDEAPTAPQVRAAGRRLLPRRRVRPARARIARAREPELPRVPGAVLLPGAATRPQRAVLQLPELVRLPVRTRRGDARHVSL